MSCISDLAVRFLSYLSQPKCVHKQVSFQIITSFSRASNIDFATRVSVIDSGVAYIQTNSDTGEKMWLIATVNLCSIYSSYSNINTGTLWSAVNIIIMKPVAYNKDVSLMQYSRMSLSRLGLAVTEPISSVPLFAQFVQRRQSCLLMEYHVQNINVMQRISRVSLQKDKKFPNGEIYKQGC